MKLLSCTKLLRNTFTYTYVVVFVHLHHIWTFKCSRHSSPIDTNACKFEQFVLFFQSLSFLTFFFKMPRQHELSWFHWLRMSYVVKANALKERVEDCFMFTSIFIRKSISSSPLPSASAQAGDIEPYDRCARS
jgi:hypothetical protein